VRRLCKHYTSFAAPLKIAEFGGSPDELRLAYFQVDDVDATASKAKQMGANLYLAPMTMEGVGRLSVIADPQGAVFAIFKSAR